MDRNKVLESEPTGRISFRTRPELHSDLLKIADAFGTDLSGILNLMLTDARPRFLAAVARMARGDGVFGEATPGDRTMRIQDVVLLLHAQGWNEARIASALNVKWDQVSRWIVEEKGRANPGATIAPVPPAPPIDTPKKEKRGK